MQFSVMSCFSLRGAARRARQPVGDLRFIKLPLIAYHREILDP
jgi:hypothetical protein